MPRQFSPRPEMGQEYPVSQSGALRKFMGCGVPVNSSFKTGGYYQSTYIGYNFYGEPIFEEQPLQIQRLEDDYKVRRVGYDLLGDLVYE